MVPQATDPLGEEVVALAMRADIMYGRNGMSVPQLKEFIRQHLESLSSAQKKALADRVPHGSGYSNPDKKVEKDKELPKERCDLDRRDLDRPRDPRTDHETFPRARMRDGSRDTFTNYPTAYSHAARLVVPPSADHSPTSSHPSSGCLPQPTFFAARCADFARGATAPSSTWPEVKYGIGPYPCWSCGTDQHSLPACPHRHKYAKCGVCGSMAHLSRDCAQRFHPDPRWASASTRPPPTSRPVATFPNNIPLPVSSPPPSRPDPTPPQSPPASPLIPPHRSPPPLSATSPSSTTPPPLKASLQAVQAWPNLWGSLASAFPSDSLACAQPVNGPPGTQQLHYQVLVNGHPALALMDPGASHSFVHPRWVARHHQTPQRLAVPYSLGTFVGAEHTVTTTLTAQLTIAGVSRPWDFLVLDRMPAEVVLGLDLMLYWPLFLNPVDKCLYVPPQTASQGPNWFTPVPTSSSTSRPTLRAMFSSLNTPPPPLTVRFRLAFGSPSTA